MALLDLRDQAYPILIMQSGVVVLIATIAACFFDLKSSGSVLLGGGVCLIPQWLFAQWVLQLTGARWANTIVKRFFVGQAMKMLLTVLLFCAVLKSFSVGVVPVIIGYIGTYLAFMFAPFLIGMKKR